MACMAFLLFLSKSGEFALALELGLRFDTLGFGLVAVCELSLWHD